MNRRAPKVSVATWIETARLSLIEEGIAAVKIDRLANRLGVTRGGFYHNFKDRDDLLGQLLTYWENVCRFLPEQPPGTTSAQAAEWLDRVIHRLIEGAAWAVERSDRERLMTLQRFFEALGYDEDEAPVRARVFYYHQIGYYAIGVHNSIAERRKTAHIYLEILCGPGVLERARGRTAAPARALA